MGTTALLGPEDSVLSHCGVCVEWHRYFLWKTWQEGGVGWAAKTETANLFLLPYALEEKFNVVNFFTFMNVLISVELPCIIQDYKMIWISGADRFSDEDFKLCNYETHIG